MTTSADHHDADGQLSLELPHEVALGHEDFFISSSNEHAYELIETWPDWPKRMLMLIGPEGSGKTHLGSIWSHTVAAKIISAADLSRDAIPRLAENPALVIEDLPGQDLDETALFHLLNLINEQHGALLMTSSTYPSVWETRLPDLASRLRAVPVVELKQPDEALLRAVLVKLFADRQLKVEEPVITYLLSRMERSIANARQLVDVLDRKSMSEAARVSRPFAAKVLKSLDAE